MKQPAELQVLLDRLRNDITRLTAVKAITTVAHSPLPIDLNLVIEPVLTELTSFMRKANRPLKQASLSAMEVRLYCVDLKNITHSSLQVTGVHPCPCPSLDVCICPVFQTGSQEAKAHAAKVILLPYLAGLFCHCSGFTIICTPSHTAPEVYSWQEEVFHRI